MFSYVVLGAGFFTTQKSQQVVHAGVTQAASNIVVKGNVYGISSQTNKINALQFDIGLAAGGIPVDVTRIVYTFSQPGVTPKNIAHATSDTPTLDSWYITAQSDTSSLLTEGQYKTIVVQPLTGMDPRGTFTLEIKPENGAALGLDRNIPAGITSTTLLY